jgi:outer membrane lipoprotein carrier protein
MLHLIRSSRKFSRRAVPFPESLLSILIVAMMAMAFVDVGAEANGIDVDGYLRDFESGRGTIATYAADFVQIKMLTLFDETKVSSGRLFYKAPERMIWKYETPDRTQMRVERDVVSFYFPALEQIERCPLGDSGSASPMFYVFEASADELMKSFDISIGVGAEQVNRIDLVPKQDPLASQFERIILWLGKSDYLPRKVTIREVTGDTTEIQFSNIRVNEAITDEEMQFDAPEGTPVVECGSGAL